MVADGGGTATRAGHIETGRGARRSAPSVRARDGETNDRQMRVRSSPLRSSRGQALIYRIYVSPPVYILVFAQRKR